MKKRRTYSIALILFAVYSLIALSPLASLALKSPALAHAINGECSGDCAICGCSPERSASRSCCCWIKRRMEQEPRPGIPPCCLAGGKKAGDSARAVNTVKRGKVKKQLTVYRCCPCGKEKPAISLGSETHPHLPYLFNGKLRILPGDASPKQFPSSLKSRHREPPDPPPKLFPLS
jgi:hypothetical protein